MKPHSLRGDLTRASLLTTLVAVLLSAGSMLGYELATYRNALMTDLRTQAELLAQSTAAALVFNDPKVAQDNLNVLKAKPSVRAAVVYGKDGRVFASYDADPTAPGRAMPAAPPAVNTEQFTDSDLELTQAIDERGERVGSVYLRARHDMGDRAASYAPILAAVTLLSLVVSYFVFGGLQRRVTGPLLDMTDVARQVMAQRDWSLRATESANQDIALLVRAFNGMLAEVQARTGQLENSNEQLQIESAERRLAEAGLKLADRRKDEFLATLAHELRNPLAPMTNAVALLRMEQSSVAVRQRALTILERQLRHVVRLIDDLLDVSRITTGKLLLRKEVVDLCAVLRAPVELAEPAIRQRQQVLDVRIPTEPFWVCGDVARLTQIFDNLLGNATRYTGPQGRIEVEMTVEPAFASVAVRDTGAGIAPEMQQRIFELFEQVDKSLERGNTGLGIGLTLARQLTELHEGVISVESAGLGHGACFTVRLPRHGEAPGAPAPPATAASAPHVKARALAVLIADDNHDYATSLGEVLRLDGHAVQIVSDGHLALSAALQRPPDVALLDIGMPGLNGYEVARRLRDEASTSKTTLVAVTGWGQAADRDQAARAGFDHHLVKPVDFDELMRVLDEDRARWPARRDSNPRPPA